MKKIVVTGKTIEDAVKSGLAQLHVTQEQVNIQILEQPVKGLFGLIGSKEAKVELEVKPDPFEEALTFIQDVIATMDLNIKIEIKNEQDATVFNLIGKELGILIGRRGQTLDSLQYLINIVANRYSPSYVKIILDAENFRERRKQTLEELSERLANRVLRTGKDVVLEPMSAQERKIIHTWLQDYPDVKTYSKGDEPNRRVVI
ncbi:MAG: DNA-binding protein, partial [Paenibacillus sp. RIFOXYA1_FULL_44_5]